MKLTFENGKFFLEKILGTKNKIPIDLKEAVNYQKVADTKAKTILERATVKRYVIPYPVHFPDFLDTHQVKGLHWILTRSRAYLAHAPGAGKTCQAIVASLFTHDPGQALFIVPPSLTLNWKKEIYKWIIELRRESFPIYTTLPITVSIVPESNKQKEMNWNAGFIIVPDSMITKPWVLNHLTTIRKKFIAVDEASRFKEATAQRTIALFGGKLKDGTQTPGLIYDSPHAVLMDGSPMPNRSMELWAPTYAMAPATIDYLDQQSFGFKYCGATMDEYGCWAFKGNSKSEELRDKLTKEFMHVVREEQLKHPERKRSLLFMTKDVRSREQKAWEKKHLSTLDFSDVAEDMSQGKIAHYRHELGMRKVLWVASYVADRLKEKDESILLFAWHRAVCFELAVQLKKFSPGIVMGTTPTKQREAIFKEFQDGKTKLLIMNIAAGGRGHNLQKADRVVFAEYSWCDETNKQAEKRASRKGSDKVFVRCDYIFCPDSIDEIVLKTVMRKQSAIAKII